MSRVDALLAELKSRHGLDAGFVARIRPAALSILDPAVPDATRVSLLEALAETCERHVQIQRDSHNALAAWQQLSRSLDQLVSTLRLLLGPSAAS